jgi:hypothetical protein
LDDGLSFVGDHNSNADRGGTKKYACEKAKKNLLMFGHNIAMVMEWCKFMKMVSNKFYLTL